MLRPGGRSVRAPRLGAVVAPSIGLLVVGGYVAWLVHLWRTTTYDTWGGMIIAPVLVALTLPALARQARREGDPRVFWLLVAALAAKLLFALIRHHFAFEVYDKADARRYNDNGAELAQHFLAGNFDIPPGDRGGGTRFMEVLTGVVYTVTRPTVVGGFLVFAWLAFWGTFYFYRAFHLAVPEGRARSYGLLLFFLPSLLYWPSGLGKESWMMLTLGVAAYGGARILTGRALLGTAILAVSLLLAIPVRPHYPALLVLALGVAYLVRKPAPGAERRSPLAKAAVLGILALMSVFVVDRTQDFVGEELATVGDIRAVLEDTAARTQQGGSEFDPVDLLSPLGPPLAAFTVLFRPLIVEANNIHALAAAVEGAFLLVVVTVRWRWILSALRSLRRQPYLALAAAYTAGGILTLSSLANFGILTRQRVLIFPAFLALLCVPPAAKRREPEGEWRDEDALARTGA